MGEITLEAERSVLGGLLLDGVVPPGLDMLRPGHFSHPLHAAVFAAILSLHARHEPIDELTVRDAINNDGSAPRQGWPAFVAELVDSMVTAANIGYHAGIVRREARRRDLQKVCASTFDRAKRDDADPDELLATALRELAQLEAGREVRRPVPMTELVDERWKAIERRYKEGVPPGLSTGFTAIDNALGGGLKPGGLTIIAGRPSMGKSALATSMLEHQAVRLERRGLLFNCEMTNEEQVERSLASEARVELGRVMSGALRADDWPKLARAAGVLATDRLAMFDGSDLSISDIRSIARQQHARTPLDIVVVDYLQLAIGVGDNREQVVSSISRGLKALAMELRIAVVALAQLNRELERRENKRPMLSDLRESGSLEQDAHQVLLLYRDEYYNKKTDEPGIAEVVIAKNRNGPTGMVKLRFRPPFTRFESLEEDQQTALPLPAHNTGDSA